MIEKFKCSCCRKIYEVTWDDCSADSWLDEEEDEVDNVSVDDEEYTEPEHCPFCGNHLVYDEADLD